MEFYLDAPFPLGHLEAEQPGRRAPQRKRSRLKEWYDDMFFQNTLFGLLGKVQMRKPEWVLCHQPRRPQAESRRLRRAQ